MTNAGEWNSNVAMLYLIIFCIPLFLMVLKWVFEAIPDQIHVNEVVEVEKIVEVPVYQTKVVEKVVYRDRPAKKKKSKNTKPVANNSIKTDVVSGLVGLGFNKSKANTIVSQLISQKNYTNSDSLMRDCLAKL